jgi:hypothetical protein
VEEEMMGPVSWCRNAGRGDVRTGIALIGVVLILGTSEPPGLALADGPALQSIAGRVLEQDGAPAANVEVFYSVANIARTEGGWGKVIVQTRSDASGRFTLSVPAPDVYRTYRTSGIWAYRRGSLVASFSVRRGMIHPGQDVTLVLAPGANAAFDVLGPRGKPVANASIVPRVLTRERLSVPDGLAERIAADTRTDAWGRAVVTAFYPEEISTAIVTAPGFGSQQFFFFGQGELGVGPRTVDLRPTGRLEGRIVGDNGTRVSDVPAMIYARALDGDRGTSTALYFPKTGGQGRFEILDIAEGKLSITGMMQPDVPRYFETNDAEVVAGKTTRMEIPLKMKVPVRGVIRDRATGRPVPGVRMLIHDGIVTTDERGVYRAFVPPGRLVWRYVDSAPAGHAGLRFVIDPCLVPDRDEEFELPAIHLDQAAVVRGIVRNESGHPVPGAAVRAIWDIDEGPNRRAEQVVNILADVRGEFVVEEVNLRPDGTCEITLSAESNGKRTPTEVKHSLGQPEPVVLQIDGCRSVSLKGRVITADERPIAGAMVHIRRVTAFTNGRPSPDAVVEVNGRSVLRTNAGGSFVTPIGLDRDGAFAAFVQAEGYENGRTVWVHGTDSGFPELVLKPDPRSHQPGEGKGKERPGRTR